MASGLAKCEYVFPNHEGGFYLRSNLRRDYYRMLQRAGLPRIRPHDLRHTCATQMLKNAPPGHEKAIAKQLGHSDVKVTIGIYGHADAGMQRTVVERMAQAQSNESLH